MSALKKELVNSVESTEYVGLRREVSSFDKSLSFVFRKVGGVVGAFATHINDILGRGEPDVPAEIRQFSEYRFGTSKLQESSYAHVGMELLQGSNFSAKLTHGGTHAESAATTHFPGDCGRRSRRFRRRRKSNYVGVS